jgi:drug/metabolite transporter (DMT)-like permease
LAIRLAIDTLPGLLMASARFLIAGGLLYAWSMTRRSTPGSRLTARNWLGALIVGGALLTIGNGGVVTAERQVASGIVALLVATVPLWMALADRLGFGQRLSPRALVGLIVGLGGMVLLVGLPGHMQLAPLGVLLALVASLSWALGSVYARRLHLPADPLLSTAMQMLCGGLLLGILAFVTGEMAAVHVERFSPASMLALLYLIVFGSLIAFSAYVWLIRAAPMSTVSTYAYVNPVVAVVLGWAFLGEPITLRTLIAGGIILVAVALIVTSRTPGGRRAGAAIHAAPVRGVKRKSEASLDAPQNPPEGGGRPLED